MNCSAFRGLEPLTPVSFSARGFRQPPRHQRRQFGGDDVAHPGIVFLGAGGAGDGRDMQGQDDAVHRLFDPLHIVNVAAEDFGNASGGDVL